MSQKPRHVSAPAHFGLTAQPFWIVREGVVVRGEPRNVPLQTRAFTHGEGALEVFRTGASGAYLLPRHLKRLEHSSQMLGLRWPGREIIEQDVHTLISAFGSQWRVRIIVSDVFGRPDGFSHVVTGVPLVLPSASLYTEGARVVSRSGVISMIPGCKSTSYAASRWLTRQAHDEGAHECVLFEGDRLREGATSNVFVVCGGEVFTPDGYHILPGITRGRILEMAEILGLQVRVGAVERELLAQADEVWLSSAIRGLMPVSQVDERRLGAPGPVYHALRARYDEDVASLHNCSQADAV